MDAVIGFLIFSGLLVIVAYHVTRPEPIDRR